MIQEMSGEEELRYRRRDFERLKPSDLFDLGGTATFIVVEKTQDKVTVIELNRKNCEAITQGGSVEKTERSFDSLMCLNRRVSL